jgi:hypothetical protein
MAGAGIPAKDDDMSTTPFGPHGHTKLPHGRLQGTTEQQEHILITDTGQEAIPISTGGPNYFSVIAVNILLSLVMLALLWIPAVCLYPATALGGIVAGFITAALTARMLPPDAVDVASLLGIIVGAVTIGILIRLEYRLAQQSVFRLTRHGIRLLLLSIWAIPIIQIFQGTTYDGTTTRYIFAVVSNPRQLIYFLSVPLNLGILLVVTVALHFLLWKAERLRKYWHTRLSWVGLK